MSQTANLASYGELMDLLESHQLTTTPAELHGILTGLQACGLDMDAKGYQGLVQDLVNNSQPLAAPVLEQLSLCYEQIRQQLASAEFALELLLPEEEATLAERTRALTQWAQGFLAAYGVQAGGSKVSADVEEALADLAEIANLSDDVDEDEETEAAFMEVEEYLRVVAMLVFNSLGRQPKASQKTLH
ncbi:UPF0149 family protein [Gallaecimonas sp. GXIMD4217]|uniref:UPF0149 family protein n=1 Tax=Gallaecimonas sp. GXIMD4217 TaxID=3131927 RepID=UPI00311AEE52